MKKRDVIGRKYQPIEKIDMFSNDLILWIIIVLKYFITILLLG